MYLVSLQVQSVVDKADTACRPSMQCRVDARVNDGRMDPTIANSKDVLILFCKYSFKVLLILISPIQILGQDSF